MANLNPLELKVVNVSIQKFNSTDVQSILPQFVELNIYQSIFEPVIKAEMLINDNIGLFVNYPLTGEELVTVQYQHLAGINQDFRAAHNTTKEIQFIIKGIRDIVVSDRARSLMYVVDLTSVEFLQNARKYVSHGYNDLIEDMAEKVYQEYIQQDTQDKFGKTKNFNKEVSLKVRKLIIPNVRPFQAIQWLAKHAVAKNHEEHFLYLFFENLKGFHFVTIQKIIQEALAIRENLKQNKYKYVSDTETVRKESADKAQELRLISNIVYNKRFSTLEKISGGYYQNELFEISMFQKAYHSQVTEVDPAQKLPFTLEPNLLNTENYINYVKNKVDNTEYANRVRYVINNYDDLDNDSNSQPGYRKKFGNANRYMHALNQIDVTITVPANMDLNAGDVIYCDLPENHGFNIVETDKYLSGLFIVNEVKHILGTGNRASTSLRIYKDGYLNSLFESSLYNSSAASRGGTVIDPATGRLVGKGGI